MPRRLAIVHAPEPNARMNSPDRQPPTAPSAGARTPASGVAHGEDLLLVRAVLARQPDALPRLIARLQCVPRFLIARNAQLGSPLRAEEIEDVAQDVLIALWGKLDGFRGEARLETWACQFVEFELRNAIRKFGRRRTVDLATVSEPAAAKVPDASEELEGIYLAMHGLDADEAAVIRLKHFDELTFDQIGERLGCSPNTAKTRYYRGLQNLRERMRRSSGHHE